MLLPYCSDSSWSRGVKEQVVAACFRFNASNFIPIIFYTKVIDAGLDLCCPWVAN